jgi:hypothetical protein
MSQVVTATFEDGFFKPDQPPALDPKARVRLIVEPLDGHQTPPNGGESGGRPAEEVSWDEFERAMDEITTGSGFRMTRDELHDRG